MILIYEGVGVGAGFFIDIEHEGLDNDITLANFYTHKNHAVRRIFSDEFRPTVTQLTEERTNSVTTGEIDISLLKSTNVINSKSTSTYS